MWRIAPKIYICKSVHQVFKVSKDEGDAFEARLAELAKRDKGVFFHSIADLVPSGDRSFHGLDMIHPSRKASKIIGQQVAALIKRADSGR